MLPLNPFSTPRPSTKPTLQFPIVAEGPSPEYYTNAFIDQRLTGFRGKSRSVTLPNVSSPGGSAICKNQDGTRCVVAGKDSLRIIRVLDPSEKHASEYRAITGLGGYRIEATRNQWAGSGLKVGSALTDVVWCHNAYDAKILTSARNGDLIVWDLQKSGPRYDKKTKCHTRSINKLAYHPVMAHYCVSASSDGDLRLWDLRDLSKSTVHIHHTFPIRTAICLWDSFNVATGLDNGSMCRWDLRMGQKGIVDRVALAHAGHVLSLDWSSEGNSGWLASAGQDRTVKIWDFSDSTSESASASTRKPSYVLHASYPIRRVIWRPGNETELAIASTIESGFHLSSKLSSSPSEGLVGHGDKIQLTASGLSGTAPVGKREPTGALGDLIEIWDVRRPWIAKWSVADSDREGGVSDMTFYDSHALWVQHASGAFSQMDLRYSNKPIDSVARTALAWTPNDTLTFVTDSPYDWEVPYDDRDPNVPWSSVSEKTKSHKKLGDPSFRLSSQTVGQISGLGEEDWESFELQARDYKIEGAGQTTLCEMNSQVAYAAGNHAAGNLWLLLQSLLIDLGPPLRVGTAVGDDPALPRSVSAPGAVPTLKRSPLKDTQTRSSSSDPPNSTLRSSPGMPARKISAKFDASVASPLSPRHPSTAPMTPRPHMASNDVTSSSTQATPAKRDTSRSTSFSTEKSSSSSSRRKRQIGEGALADSDDESDPESAELSVDRQRSVSRSSASKDVFVSQGTPSANPRVLSRRFVSSPGVLEDIDDWAEDEKEEDSASPASSLESDSAGSVASTRVARSSSQQRKVRSRSSTQASAPTNAPLVTMNITRTDSQSSVLTVTAGVDHLAVNESSVVLDTSSIAPSTRSKSQNRQSAIHSMSGVNVADNADEGYVLEEDVNFLEWNHDIINQREEDYRESNWDAFKLIIEEMADQGEIQMCAMLSCIAPVELGIKPWRALQFIEAYIDILSRLRLHTVAAYLRKYAPLAEIRQFTQVQTTAYTNCARCRKPLIHPVNGARWLGYNYCLECKRPVISCTICHLPVRTAAFVCAVCSHGGHRDCYYRYYMHRPMVELSTTSFENRGRKSTRPPASSSAEATDNSVKSEDRARILDKSIVRINGHPCAAGCGHHCWASSQRLVSA